MVSSRTTSPSILIVDDDLALVAFLTTRLEYEPGFRVAGFATDSAEAIDLARAIRPDIIISDYDLPDAEGLSLVQCLRVAAPDAAIVLYTAVWSTSLERAARLSGADDCLDKTTPPRVLVQALRDAYQARAEAISA